MTDSMPKFHRRVSSPCRSAKQPYPPFFETRGKMLVGNDCNVAYCISEEWALFLCDLLKKNCSPVKDDNDSQA